MKILSEDVPQADKLEDVLKLVEAVAKGASTFQEQSKYIGKVERQGRYYRRSAEILGFIQQRSANHATLTKLGREYLSSSPQRQKELLAQAVLASRMMQRVIPFLESKRNAGANRAEIEEFIKTVTEETGPTMVPRRTSSVIAWLLTVKLLQQNGDRFVLGNLPKSVELIDYVAEDEPLFPKKYDFKEYQNLATDVKKENKVITVFINEAQKDRAVNSHRVLTNLMAEKIKKTGAIPKRNPYIDLSALINGKIYLFEMKSTTVGNAHDQIRRGISQLYEYRYIQKINEACLVLVLENPLPDKLSWFMNYLMNDRNILLVWDGDGLSFHCSEKIKEDLNFIF